MGDLTRMVDTLTWTNEVDTPAGSDTYSVPEVDEDVQEDPTVTTNSDTIQYQPFDWRLIDDDL